MATEEESREAATDDQEVQMEAEDHLQTQIDSKLSTIKEIKGEAHITDSTEGMSKISEDQVLVEAPSETITHSEHNLNGMASSLNGYVDQDKISNGHPIAKTAEAIEDDKDKKTGEISDQSSEVFAEESAKGKGVLENESTADTQPMQELESEEASADQAAPYQSNVAQCEEQATEENITESEPQILETESVQDTKDVEATEPERIFHQAIVSTSEESVPEENATEKEPAYDIKEIQNDEPELIKEHDDVKAEEISNQSSGVIVEETVHETNLLASEPINDVQVKDLESVQIRNTVDVETEEASHQTHAASVEDNWTASEPEKIEPSEQMRDTEPTEPEPTLHDSTVAIVEEIATQDNAAIEQEVGRQQLLEQELVEFKETEALEPQGVSPSDNVSTSEEFNTQETITKDEPSSDTQAEESSVVIKDTEDVKSSVAIVEEAAQEEHVVLTETTADTLLDHEPELEEKKNIESVEAENNIAASDLPEEEMDNKAIGTESSTTAGIKECSENEKSNAALDEEVAPEEHILETEVAVDISSVQDPELEEIKNTEPSEQEHNITASGLPEEVMNNEARETEVIPYDSNVSSIKELTEDVIVTASALDADTQQVPEQQSVEDMKCTDTTEHPVETPQSTFSTSDDLTPTGEKTVVRETTCDTQQVQSLTDQETKDSQYVKTEEFSELSTFSTPEEAAQESDVLKSEPASDVQQAQELDSAEETRGTENVETNDCQQNEVSTLEETTLENNVAEVEPNVDDQHMQEDKVDDQHVQEDKSVVEVKENEASEIEEISKQINFTTSENVAQESSESGSDQVFCVQPEQQIELTKDSEENQLVEAEETSSQSNIITIEDPTGEDRVANEIEPSVDANQEHELELAEEIKDTDTTETEEVFQTGATEEMKGTEDISGEEICNQQTGTSEGPSPTDNGTTVQDYTVETNEENLGDGIDDVISMHEKIKDKIQESAELKDEASELGEKNQRSENSTEEDDVHISTEDTIETSHNINPIKEEPKDVVLQTQVCEISVDTIVIGKQDKVVTNASLDQQHKEDERIEQQKEELQTDEQKHDDKTVDFIIDTQVEPIDAFEAEQTDTVVTEMLKNEVTQHIYKDSIPRIADVMVENITEIKEFGDENGPNNEGPLEVAAGSYNDDVQESTEKDAVVAKTSSSEHDETTDEIINEQVKPCLASSMERDLQAVSGLSNDQMLENNTIVVPHHVRHDKYRAQPEKEETSQRHSSEQYSVDTKTDDTTVSFAEITHENTSTQPREIEDTDEKKGFSDISEFVVETSKQNNVEQDFSIHHQVEDEKLSATEQNVVDIEVMQPKVDLSVAETNNDSITNPLPEHETEIASDINQNGEHQEATNVDDAMQLEPEEKMQLELEENAIGKTADCIEKMETSYTEATDVVTCNEDICDKASGADRVPSDESVKTFEDTRRNLDVLSVVTESKGENMNKEMEDYKLALPVHPTQDENTTEEALGLDNTEKELTTPEKALPSEPEEQEENQVSEEQDGDDRHDPEIRDMQKEEQKEAEQDYLPVSSFLMNLILGKESNDLNRKSETEAEKKQEETSDDNSCSSQQEESLVSFPTENMVDQKLTFEQEKENVKGSEETHEPVKEQSRDVKLDIKRSLETDEELKRDTHDLEDNAQDEISIKLISAEATGLIEKIKARNFELDEKPFDTVWQENMEVATEIEDGSLKSNQDGTTNPKTPQQSALEEGETELPHESLHEDRSSDAMTEQTLSLIDPDIGDATKLPSDADNVQNPPCIKQEESIEYSYVEVRSTTEAPVESEEVEKKEENQHTISGGDTKDDMWKGKGSEAISDHQVSETANQVSHAEINFAYEEEIPASSTCMDERESDKFPNNEVSNFEKALEIHSDSPSLPVNQDKQDESTDNKIVMEHNSLLDKPEDSNLQEQQKTDIAQKFPIDADEGKQKFMDITESVMKEENVRETVKIKSNEEQEVFASQVQERGLDVVSPKAVPEVEENFVNITKPEFSTDEEQSPKADESNIPEEKTYIEKTKDEEEINNITDEATLIIEGRGTGQKASHKKHNILSGVGSKVKHQLAKVKKAIIAMPPTLKIPNTTSNCRSALHSRTMGGRQWRTIVEHVAGMASKAQTRERSDAFSTAPKRWRPPSLVHPGSIPVFPLSSSTPSSSLAAAAAARP
ncbi:hypothetical protein ABZP36_021090 [Zizania latifolia]